MARFSTFYFALVLVLICSCQGSEARKLFICMEESYGNTLPSFPSDEKLSVRPVGIAIICSDRRKLGKSIPSPGAGH